MASSSSSHSLPVLSSQSWNYDVFLSFRGEDTRKTFVDHLYSALEQQGIYTYKDDVTLPRGKSISPALLTAIEESQIAVIIFSKNYANSSWCLDELTHIMKRREEGKQTVFPIFYDVEPTDVRKQKRTYKEAFDKHELENTKKIKYWGQAVLNGIRGWFSTPQDQPQLKNKVKVDSWRNALVDASNISGWETKQIANGHEALGIKQIVAEISQKLVTSRVNEDLIGMRARVQGLKSELQIESGAVRMIGIWGVAGGGKMTLASSIYDEISSMYGGCCFLRNIREESSKIGLEKLQKKMLFDIFKQDHMEMDRLRRKNVLIVLDDVDKLEQLQELVGSRDWFDKGSRIIITTRDEHLLKAHGVDVIQQISLLNNDEAVRLFCKYTHQGRKPTKDFEKLSKEVVSYAGGLPLALKVLGSFLCGRNSMQWRSALYRLKDIPNKDIIGILRISFDGLEQDEKDLFLDIACFFRGERKEYAMTLLQACGLHPVIGVEVLRQKALITISKHKFFDMHDLVQEMGHYIVRGKHPRNPQKHNRVWKREDVLQILDMAATTELDNIEAIDLRSLSYEEKQRFIQVAGNMNKLRWIDLECWEQRDENIVPLPANFPPRQLCYLYAQACIRQKQLWEGYKYLPNLTHMELIKLPNLIKIPDFSGLPKLKTFTLMRCPCLEKIHPSIGSLESLVSISIYDCQSLRMFPSLTRMKKLETLVLSACSLGDEEIGSDFWDLPNLEKLSLCRNPLISRLDFSILRLPRLKWLNVSLCEGLVELLELPSSIAIVTADYCTSLETFGDISNCKWLWNVSLKEGNKLHQERCDTLIRSMLQGNATSEDHFISVALCQHQLPDVVIGRLFRGNTFRLNLPDDWYNDYCGFLIRIVTGMLDPIIHITMEQEDSLSHEESDEKEESDEELEPIRACIGYVSFSSLSHNTTLISSYNIILVTIEDMKKWKYKGASTYSGIEFIPRKSKSDEVQTTDYSEFWDEKLQDAGSHPFAIQQCDSDSSTNSSTEISWNPFFSFWHQPIH